LVTLIQKPLDGSEQLRRLINRTPLALGFEFGDPLLHHGYSTLPVPFSEFPSSLIKYRCHPRSISSLVGRTCNRKRLTG